MKRLENHPATTAVLCCILVGAIVITVLRIKGPDVTAAERASAEAPAQARESSTDLQDSLDEQNPGQRDPFKHALLFVDPNSMDAASPDVLPGGRDFPGSPMMFPNLQSLRPDSTSTESAATQSSLDSAGAREPTVGPRLHLRAIVWGAEPLAVIKDAGGKSYFVRVGDRFGEGYEVARIERGQAMVGRDNTLITLRLSGESEADGYAD